MRIVTSAYCIVTLCRCISRWTDTIDLFRGLDHWNKFAFLSCELWGTFIGTFKGTPYPRLTGGSIFCVHKKRNICERAVLGVDVYKISSRNLEYDRGLVFWRPKTAIFDAVPWDFLCFRLSSFVLFGPFKKCSRAIFRVLDETDLKTCLPEPNIQSDLSLTSWPWP